MTKYIIDRFETNWATMETMEDPVVIFNLPKNLLPKNAKEGDVLDINITVDKKATLERKNVVQNKLDLLKKRNGGDDLAL